MSRQVLYVAAPLRPTEAEIDAIQPFTVSPGRGEYEVDAKIWKPHETRLREALRANLDRAMRWISWLRRSFPETTFIAPWIATVMSLGNDDSPVLREAGLVDDCAVIERCDGIVLCGGRISDGMRREMDHGVAFWNGPSELNRSDEPVRFAREFAVYDLISLGNDPPHAALRVPRGCSFREWVRDCVCR